jgi:hypothetical protein
VSGIDLYWLPLGAGGHSVRLNGLVFEAIASALQRRDRRDLYHSALVADVAGRRFVIEMTPVGTSDGAVRGVVSEGSVGLRAAGRFRLFRYEVRCWPDGVIPDVAEAVESPQRLSVEPEHARRLVDLVPRPDPGLGPRRTRRRRDVELELARLVADRDVRARGGVDPSAGRRARAGMGRRDRGRQADARRCLPIGEEPPHLSRAVPEQLLRAARSS